MSTHTTTYNPDELPLAPDKRDLARLLAKSTRSVERYIRAGLLPEPVVPGRWSRDQILSWLAGSPPRRRRT